MPQAAEVGKLIPICLLLLDHLVPQRSMQVSAVRTQTQPFRYEPSQLTRFSNLSCYTDPLLSTLPTFSSTSSCSCFSRAKASS